MLGFIEAGEDLAVAQFLLCCVTMVRRLSLSVLLL